MNDRQLEKIRFREGFIAALDQSGGSTPKALRLYGVGDDAWSGDDEMFDVVHAMRTRIITSPSFGGDRILGAILFEDTMGREIGGRPSARYLWEEKGVVPFLKVDRGLGAEADGVRTMKPMPALDSLLARAKENGVFGTKMRSVVRLANPAGVKAVVDQQFEIGRRILDAGLAPIIEPEIDIHSPEKAQAEELIYLGDHIRTRFTVCGHGDFIVKIPNSAVHGRLRRGETVRIGWNAEDCRALDPSD